MSWIDDIIRKSVRVSAESKEEQMLVDNLVDAALSLGQEHGKDKGLILAAFFDLAICSVYYTYITNSGWMYCKNNGDPKLVLPFVNCCPIHALKNQFIFHQSSKPTSALIGKATSRILLLFFQALFNRYGKRIDVYKATEPADAIFLDRSQKSAYFAEIKASPLLTMSIATNCDLLTEEDEEKGIIETEHRATANPNLIGKELFIMLPVKNATNRWEMKYYPLGTKKTAADKFYAYYGIESLLTNEEFIKDYLNYWISSFRLYCEKNDTESIFWFTNACGKPANLKNWGGGTTCISDAKTSVGMDRTDDIKKGIYQVLKLGSEGKLHYSTWNYKVGILSNIHPVRHFDSYISPIKDLIWTSTSEKNINFARDLSGDTPMYNLFDGIITFTESFIRDKWLYEDLFSFIN